MRKNSIRGRWIPGIFLFGSLCGTAGALLSPVPLCLSEMMAGGVSVRSALLHAFLPMLPAFFVGKMLFPAVVLFRACTVSWTLTLLIRAGQLPGVLTFCVSLLFLLPAFFLLVEEGSDRIGSFMPRGAKTVRHRRCLLFFVFWLTGSAVRFFLPHMFK